MYKNLTRVVERCACKCKSNSLLINIECTDNIKDDVTNASLDTA